jgi:hypothetical protein
MTDPRAERLSLLKNMFGPGIVTPMIATGTSLSCE